MMRKFRDMSRLLMAVILLALLTMAVVGCSDDEEKIVTPPDPPTIAEPGDSGPMQTPGTTSWWNDQVFYEVFVRSFYDHNGDGKGDLQGLIEKLDYLNDGDPETDTDLGVTALWLMPITQSPSYHGYDVVDYREVEIDYGTTEDFQELMTEAHSRGIKVIIDYVMNHSSSQNTWFSNASSHPDNEFRNWYRFSDTHPDYNGPWNQNVWHTSPTGYYYGLFWGGMPDLNYEEPDVVDEMYDVARYWLEDMGVDGFRLDAVMYIIEDGSNLVNTAGTFSFWENFSAYCQSVNPETYLVGEAWDASSLVVQYVEAGFSTCFEFDLAGQILNAISSGNASALKAKMQRIVEDYPYHRYSTFLTNHDQNRIFELLSKEIPRMKSAAAIYLTLPGVPYLYYGEEVAMLGQKPDENIRRPMQWTSGNNAGFTTGTPWHNINYNYQDYNVETMAADENSLWHWYRKLIKARTDSPALRRGTYQELGTSASALYAFLRIDGDDAVLALHNVSISVQSNYGLGASETQLPPGTYDCVNLLGGSDGATLIVEADGRIPAWGPTETLGSKESQVYRLVRQ